MTAEDPAQNKEIEIGVVVPSLLYALILIAEQRGFLAEEGLRVTLRSFGTADRLTEALLDRRNVQ
jgi:ABC-type nitrate/sulfonate/bicarbonate transport system substrate-binding protein